MTLRIYLILMSIGTALCWIAWFFVIANISPENAGFIGLLFFYLSLYLAIVGTFSVIGFSVRQRIIQNDDVVFRHVRHTFRQSISLASFIVLSLLLKSAKLLAWWNMIILLIMFITIETLVFTNRKFRNIDYVK